MMADASDEDELRRNLEILAQLLREARAMRMYGRMELNLRDGLVQFIRHERVLYERRRGAPRESVG